MQMMVPFFCQRPVARSSNPQISTTTTEAELQRLGIDETFDGILPSVKP